MNTIIKPVNGYDYSLCEDCPSVFLAGSIDNGVAENWQLWATQQLEDTNIFNPRVDWWNPEANDADVQNQINWELHHLEKCDVVAMFFADKSKAPISFLELGLFLREKPVVIYCNPAFYRFINVKTTSQKYGVEVYSDKNLWINKLKEELDNHRLIT